MRLEANNRITLYERDFPGRKENSAIIPDGTSEWILEKLNFNNQRNKYWLILKDDNNQEYIWTPNSYINEKLAIFLLEYEIITPTRIKLIKKGTVTAIEIPDENIKEIASDVKLLESNDDEFSNL